MADLFGFQASEHEPPAQVLPGTAQKKPPTMQLTFASPRQLQGAKKEVLALLAKYPGAFASVKAGEL